MKTYQALYIAALHALRNIADNEEKPGQSFFGFPNASSYAADQVEDLVQAAKHLGKNDPGIDPTPLVTAFHCKYGQDILSIPHLPDNELLEFRLELAREELKELSDAIEARDLVKIADALGDKVYVDYGTALVCGIPLSPVIVEIHRSNMTKDINPKGGKPLKGPGFREPRLREAIHINEPRAGGPPNNA